jgi:predicted deacylase
MKSSNDVLTIAGVDVKLGQRLTINIPVARLYTHTEMTMPVHILRGNRGGHRLFVSAAVHGDEILGVEIVRRLLKVKALKRLSGTLIAVPVVNVYGFVNQSRYLPDRRDLNRFFPGSKKGSLTSRLADIFMNEVVANSTHGIDLHTASNHRTNLPQIRACLDDPETERLATAFGAPVILDANLRDGSLRQAVMEKGVPMLMYEGGEALRFDEVAAKAGVRGILAVMRGVGMLPKRALKKPRIQPAIARSSTWVRAPMSGILRSNVRLGARISEGTKLGEIADPFGEEESEVVSSESGVVIGRLNLPLVHRGDALFHVACFKRPSQVADTLEAFEEEFENSVS